MLRIAVAVIAVIAAFVGITYLRFSGDDATRPGVHSRPGEDAVVATRTIPSGTRIEDDMVSLERMAAAQLVPNVYRDTAMVVGKKATNNILAGDQVTHSDVEGPVVPEGMSAVGLRIQQTTPVGGLVSPGAWVDVVARYEDGRRVVTPVVENVQVLSSHVSTAVIHKEALTPSDVKAQAEELVTLAVPPASAALLLDAQLKASRLWLQLRPVLSRVP